MVHIVILLTGLFAYSHMDFEVDRDPGPTGDPSLADMTRSALSILQKNPKGFFLFVESGRIDHAHHYNNAYRALDETLALETALLAALALVNPTETLLVLTADHSHVFTFGGQATPRGHPILGLDNKVSDVDGQPYTTILYTNGPGYSNPRSVPMNVTTPMESKNQVFTSAVPRQWATHSGEDVPVYALGPLATTLFAGTFDQSYIPHAIAYSACLGEHRLRCQGLDNYTSPLTTCVAPEVSSVSAANGPVVIASSVMADDSARPKSSCGIIKSAGIIGLYMVLILEYAVT
ncbi:alkaline phosphatase [Holotrichia oblita]|uniref:Alkaline phosphatase n=1 Tax=Holotrichia oblita TaxID=644536 RepID=A0ACB9SVJ6_HOLOL|nr:alkaline phosphatase [Holotrichia oblita]